MNKLTITLYAIIIGANIGFAQPNSDNSLCKAVWDEDLVQVEILLAQGLDPQTVCDHESTAIDLATVLESKKVLLKLLSHVASESNINWDFVSQKVEQSEDRRFKQYIKNEQNRIEAIQGLKGEAVIPMCAPQKEGAFLGVIFCDGHAFIHTNVSLFGAPPIKRYDNSTGELFAFESDSDEYIGFYPKPATWPNIAQLVKFVALGGRYLFPAVHYSSWWIPLQSYLFGKKNGWSGGQAILIDERKYYDEATLAQCQKIYLKLDVKEFSDLASFLRSEQAKVEKGDSSYSLFSMNCVDFVRHAIKSAGKDSEIVNNFRLWNSGGGFSYTSAWAYVREMLGPNAKQTRSWQ